MYVIIAGAGQVGGHAAEVLSTKGHNVTVIDLDGQRLRTLSGRRQLVPLEWLLLEVRGEGDEEGRGPQRSREEGRVALEELLSALGLGQLLVERTNLARRGMGEVADSGLALCEPYLEFDAERRFGLSDLTTRASIDCISGSILQGKSKPFDCAAFGNSCTPERPLGATMVSSEGACAAYYRYRSYKQDIVKIHGE